MFASVLIVLLSAFRCHFSLIVSFVYKTVLLRLSADFELRVPVARTLVFSRLGLTQTKMVLFLWK